MIKTLNELTKGELWGDLEQFNQIYGKEIAEKLELHQVENFKFYDNGSELLIYRDNKAIVSCCYTEYKEKKYITSCYDKNGLLFENSLPF